MTIPEGFAQITQTFTGTGLPHGAAVVYGVECGSILTAQEVADEAKDAWATSMRSSQTIQVAMSETLAKLGPDDTGPSAVSTGGGNGTGGGSMAPPNVGWLLTKNTALGGRRGRGRMFVPGANEAGIDPDGVLVGANLTQLQTDATDLLATLNASGIPMVLLHGPATEWVLVDGQPRRVPVAGAIPDPTPVTSLTASSIVATQRRRLRG